MDSTNYDPMMGWSSGSQLVALNYQTPGKFKWMNHGLFRDNGGQGYIFFFFSFFFFFLFFFFDSFFLLFSSFYLTDIFPFPNYQQLRPKTSLYAKISSRHPPCG